MSCRRPPLARGRAGRGRESPGGNRRDRRGRSLRRAAHGSVDARSPRPERREALVLNGPPGTAVTFCARRIRQTATPEGTSRRIVLDTAWSRLTVLRRGVDLSIVVPPGVHVWPGRGLSPDEHSCVSVESRLAAEVGVERLRTGRDAAVADEVDQRRHRLSLVHRIGEHPLEPRAEADRLDRLCIRDAVGAGVPSSRRTISSSPGGGRARSLRRCDGQCARSGTRSARPSPSRRSRARYARAPVLRSRRSSPLGRSGDRAHDDRVEEDPERGLLIGDLAGPAGEAHCVEAGSRGWAGEVANQEAALGIFFDTIVVCSVTGRPRRGWMAPGFAGRNARATPARDRRLGDGQADLGSDARIAVVPPDAIRLRPSAGGRGNRPPRRVARRHLRHPDAKDGRGDPLCARLEGMRTDPVYEGKSMAALIDLVRDGRVEPGSKVLYAHLGGQPALNGYAGAFVVASSPRPGQRCTPGARRHSRRRRGG